MTLPLTIPIPQFGQLVFRLSENAAYAAALKGEIGPIVQVGRKKAVVVRPALQRLAQGNSAALEQMTSDLLAKLTRERPAA
jgi:hypothetical protein